MKIKLALFESDYGFVTREPEQEKYTSYNRVSEYIDVEFPMLEETEVIGKKIAVIEKEIEEIKTTAMQQISDLQAKKQELMALTVSNGDQDGK